MHEKKDDVSKETLNYGVVYIKPLFTNRKELTLWKYRKRLPITQLIT